MKIKIMRSYQRLYLRLGEKKTKQKKKTIFIYCFGERSGSRPFFVFVFVFRNVFCFIVAIVVSFAS